jgi:hypothetical protein
MTPANTATTPSAWSKFEALMASAGQAIGAEFSKDEKAVLALVQPLLGAAEGMAVQDLIAFVEKEITAAESAKSLADWETALMNSLEAEEAQLLGVAQSLGSNLFQSLIGLVLQKLAVAAVAAV